MSSIFFLVVIDRAETAIVSVMKTRVLIKRARFLIKGAGVFTKRARVLP